MQVEGNLRVRAIMDLSGDIKCLSRQRLGGGVVALILQKRRLVFQTGHQIRKLVPQPLATQGQQLAEQRFDLDTPALLPKQAR